MDTIRIRGARTHNLKNIDLDLPRDKLIVITGLSGSGKSSLAFDTIYAEGQRRYVESLSAYARQFLSMMEKPDVDHIEGQRGFAGTRQAGKYNRSIARQIEIDILQVMGPGAPDSDILHLTLYYTRRVKRGHNTGGAALSQARLDREYLRNCGLEGFNWGGARRVQYAPLNCCGGRTWRAA